jgi:hypothetical protein
VSSATWSAAGQLDYWVKEGQEWWGRVRGSDGHQVWIKAADLRPLNGGGYLTSNSRPARWAMPWRSEQHRRAVACSCIFPGPRWRISEGIAVWSLPDLRSQTGRL